MEVAFAGSGNRAVEFQTAVGQWRSASRPRLPKVPFEIAQGEKLELFDIVDVQVMSLMSRCPVALGRLWRILIKSVPTYNGRVQKLSYRISGRLIVCHF
jgi:hypothetical protein